MRKSYESKCLLLVFVCKQTKLIQVFGALQNAAAFIGHAHTLHTLNALFLFFQLLRSRRRVSRTLKPIEWIGSTVKRQEIAVS